MGRSPSAFSSHSQMTVLRHGFPLLICYVREPNDYYVLLRLSSFIFPHFCYILIVHIHHHIRKPSSICKMVSAQAPCWWCDNHCYPCPSRVFMVPRSCKYRRSDIWNAHSSMGVSAVSTQAHCTMSLKFSSAYEIFPMDSGSGSSFESSHSLTYSSINQASRRNTLIIVWFVNLNCRCRCHYIWLIISAAWLTGSMHAWCFLYLRIRFRSIVHQSSCRSSHNNTSVIPPVACRL